MTYIIIFIDITFYTYDFILEILIDLITTITDSYWFLTITSFHDVIDVTIQVFITSITSLSNSLLDNYMAFSFTWLLLSIFLVIFT
jgi:hypothetical protein